MWFKRRALRFVCHKSDELISISKIILMTILMAFSTHLSAAGNIAVPTRQNISVAQQLGWVKENNPYNICGGYYNELPIQYTPNPYVQSQEENYDISADNTTYAFKGISTLTGNVEVVQPDRKLTSDIAHIYPNKVTGKPEIITVKGNVHLMEPGRLMLAKTGKMHVQTKEIDLNDVTYRMALNENKTVVEKNVKTGKEEIHLYQMNALGEAKEAHQIRPGLIKLKSGTYTTCPPDRNTWKLYASTVNLNHDTGRGSSYNTRLALGGIPVFYFPYFNFPIDRRRQTGFLTPSLSSSSKDGVIISLPYYINLAPNYDLTLTPELITRRGLLFKALYRYLTETSTGYFHMGYIDSDRGFRHFRKRALSKYSTSPTINRLRNDSDNRGSFSLNNQTQFNEHWKSTLDYNYVTDDYYIHDFGSNLIDNSQNQLLRQLQFNYADNTWNFLGNLQSYQTLHPVDQSNVSNQYGKLPQLQLNGAFPNVVGDLNFGLQTEFVRFTEHKNPYDSILPVIGDRTNVRPSATLPFIWPYAYLIPRVQLQMTKYDVSQTLASNPKHPGVAIPMFDVKGGLYFDRDLHLFNHPYQQTLEPTIYYLYVPYYNQDRLPIFDTSAQTFSYDMLYQDNRFSGIDRIGDANQISLGLTTRFLDGNDGSEKASASIGQIHYFRERKVSLCSGNNCTIQASDKRSVSPIAAQATYNFNPDWNANAGLTWNTHDEQFQDETVGVQYKPDLYHIVNMNYHYLRGGDAFLGAPQNSPKNDLKQTDLSGIWKLNNHWSIMGRWNYNWSHEHAQTYFFGFAYESCCWAVRVVDARTFVEVDPRGHNKFDNKIYLQFVLKGLGNIGNSNPDSLLGSSINGYTDTFGQEN